jgi:hypothetical protein
MPVMYSELSKDAALSFHLWDVDENSIERRFIAHATIPLFSKWAVLRAGWSGDVMGDAHGSGEDD